MENLTGTRVDGTSPDEGANLYEGGEQARNMADAVARRSYGKLVAFLAARTQDVAAAEDALSEAFASALADWPRNGWSLESRGVASHRRTAKGDRCCQARTNW
jgi:hypothetical protein